MADFGGRYRRVRLLGAGGMGEVWLAHDEELDDRPVAIKIMHPRMLADAEDAARFQREMRLAARMQHPNIMTVYTTGADNGAPFMVMEYLAGRDLSHVSTGALDPGRVAGIGRDACAALAYAHAQGVVHRDIKPGNLFLCDSGLVKVTDFGIAKAVSGTSLSATGTLVGTLPYMAPEQWLGQPAAFGNDIWAVGCVLYELLAGRLPRAYATPSEYVAAAARREPVVPVGQVASVPSWLSEAVMAMLRPLPQERPSASDCVGLLSGMPAVRPGGVAASAPPARRRSRPGIVLAAAALAVVAAAGGTAFALAGQTGNRADLAGGPGTGRPPATAARSSAPLATATGRPATASASGLVPAGSTASPVSPAASGSPAATAPASADSPSVSGAVSVTSPPPGTWMAQLGSVPVSAGSAALQTELDQISAQVPGAQVLLSADYASLRSGYWVIYYAGSFSDGTQALTFCASHGRTTANQCIGRYLSHNLGDFKYACYPPGGSQEATCFHP